MMKRTAGSTASVISPSDPHYCSQIVVEKLLNIMHHDGRTDRQVVPIIDSAICYCCRKCLSESNVLKLDRKPTTT